MKKTIVALMVIMTSLTFNVSGQSEVRIGNQVWSRNLDVDRFRNGDVIPEAKTDAEWKKAGENHQPAWCYASELMAYTFDNKPINATKYGKFYNWYAVNDPRGLAPKGWHVATLQEYMQLIELLGGKSVAGKKMKSRSEWQDNGNGTDESGFNSYPVGGCGSNREFGGYGKETYIWCATEYDSNSAFSIALFSKREDIAKGYEIKVDGLSVRCVKD
jgi:uncharacterized protein (TIGR02145 family)